ncbi:MAG: glutamyl-tRNA reductase [Elusimicrobiota bacterium]
MTPSFTVVGLSHVSAPVGVRERLSLNEKERNTICLLAGRECGMDEAVVLATCSRFEVYGNITEERLGAVKDWLCRRAGQDLGPMLYSHRGREAVRHLCRVAAGMDSWLVGETEILGQVKAAYLRACGQGTAGRACHLAFQRTLNVARRVRRETNIVGGIASIGGAASVLARRIFTDLQEKRILVFGAGAMAESTVRHLCAKGVSGVWVSNRSLDRAGKLAARLGGVACSLEDGFNLLTEADIAVVSTGADGYLIDAARAEAVSRRRGSKPLFIIDIAVPRNVDPAAGDVSGIYLYDIDSLRKIVEDSLANRRKDIDEADGIVAEESRDLWDRIVRPPDTAGSGRGPRGEAALVG